MNLKEEIRHFVLKLPDGVDMIGFAAVSRFKEIPLVRHPSLLLPEAKTVIVIASQLFRSVTENLSANNKQGEVSYQNIFKAHKEVVDNNLNQMGYKIAHFLTRNGYPSVHLDKNITDARNLSAIFSFKYAAYLAGLGVIGNNKLLLTKEFGPRIRLCSVITQAPLEADQTLLFEPCKSCNNICVKACPCGALKELSDGKISYNKFLCSTFYSNNGGCSLCLGKCPIK